MNLTTLRLFFETWPWTLAVPGLALAALVTLLLGKARNAPRLQAFSIVLLVAGLLGSLYILVFGKVHLSAKRAGEISKSLGTGDPN